MLGLAVLLFSTGVFLIILELFVPSMGILSITAGLAFVASIVLAFEEGVSWGLGFLGATLVVVPVLFLVGVRVFPSTPVGRWIMLDAPDRSEAKRGRDVTSEPLHDLVGRRGRTTSKLRPAGIIEIDGRRFDVVTEGEWIDPGATVVVTQVEGNRTVVRAVGASPAADAAPSEESS